MANGNEILSMKQAKNIIETNEEIMANTVRRIEEKNNEFVDKISTIWEDQNAVDFMQLHKRNMEEIINELNNNKDIYANAVKDIADAYARVGGNSDRLTSTPRKLAANISVERVKPNFTGSGNDDDFGFKNPELGAEQVMDAFNELKTSLERIAADATNRIRSINAFGNTQVQLNLAQSSGKIVGIVLGAINASSTGIAQAVAETARRYTSIGQSAETASNLNAE